MSQTCVPPRIILKTWLIFNSIKDFQALVHNLKDSSYLKEKKSAVGCEASYQHPKGISFLNSESLRNKIHTFSCACSFQADDLKFLFYFFLLCLRNGTKKAPKGILLTSNAECFFHFKCFSWFQSLKQLLLENV